MCLIAHQREQRATRESDDVSLVDLRADIRPGCMEFDNWALTEDSSEAYRATYVLLVSAVLLPVILFARRGCMSL